MSRFGADVLERALAAIRRPEPARHAPIAAEVRGEDPVELCAALCRQFEGLYLKPYLCPAGVWTIGYGATHYEGGRRVMPTDPAITPERAEALLQWGIRTVYLPQALRLCPGADTPGRQAMLADFNFNLGAGRLEASTLRRRVNAGDWRAVPGELRKWVFGGGRRLRGLERRREAEISLL